MSQAAILRSNEQVKAASQIAIQFGSALFGAAVVKVYVDHHVQLETLGWAIVGALLIWAGYGWLTVLEPEV